MNVNYGLFKNICVLKILLVAGCVLNYIFPLVDGIAEGHIVQVGEIPYHVSLQKRMSKINNSVAHFCGGTIFDSQMVLTSAECILNHLSDCDASKSSCFIRAGTINLKNKLTPGFVDVAIRQSLINFHYLPTRKFHKQKNNIGVVYLRKPFKYTGNIKSIPFSKMSPKEGTICQISGWGTEEQGSNSLKTGYIEIKSQKFCDEQLTSIVFDSKTMLCGVPLGKVTCNVDLGGAVICDESVVGVISTHSGCKQNENSLTSFINLATYKNIIFDDPPQFGFQ